MADYVAGDMSMLEQQQSDYQIPDVNMLAREDRLHLFQVMAQTMDLPYQAALMIIDRVQEESGAAGFVAASAAAVAGLEKQTFHAGGDGDGDVTECAICLKDFEDGEEVSVMPCFHGHGFHSDCIATWLGRSNMCPLCRHQLPTAVDGD